MNARAKIILCATLLAVAGCVVVYSLAGSSGVPMVLEKSHQIRELQQQNADLQREIELKKEHIRSLTDNRSDQELEIRRELKLLKKKETNFILPNQKK